MKTHQTKEECFAASNLPEGYRVPFYKGWYACGNEINNGLDSDWAQDELESNGFITCDGMEAQ